MADGPTGAPAPLTDQLPTDHRSYATHLEREAAAIAAAVALDPAAVVRSCPGWTQRDLALHVAAACDWATDLLGEGRTAPSAPLDAAQVEARHGGDPVVALRESAGALARTIRTVPSDRPVWSFAAQPHEGVAFWARRIPLDVAVHRWDAEDAAHAAGLAAGPAAPLDGALAIDGIAEFFAVFVTVGLATGAVRPAAVHLRLETDEGPVLERDLGLPADEPTVLRGPASDLLLGLWHRLPLLPWFVSGDRDCIEHWPAFPS